MSDVRDLQRRFEADLWAFAQYVNPHYAYGEIHRDVFRWLSLTETAETEEERQENINQLLLLPRGHLKSHCIAVWVAWKITREPWTSIIYVTAGEDLGAVQMAAIKGIFESERYRLIWPEMFHENPAKREKWSVWSINVDHPLRKERGIRDYTLLVKTLGSSATGLHADCLIYDDAVTVKNAYTEAGRELVSSTLKDFNSVLNPGGIKKAAGTRYDERDAYGGMISGKRPLVDRETGELIKEIPLWAVYEKVVEDKGDGTGNFLWPRMQAKSKAWFGFDVMELARIKSEILSQGESLSHFYSQYYNNPHSQGADIFNNFQYYNRAKLRRVGETWYYGDTKLEVTCAADFAWTELSASSGKKADFTVYMVVGMDAEGFLYILDIARFKTAKYSVYYSNLARLYDQWRFRRVYAEQENAAKLIVEELQNMVRQNGLPLAIIGKNVPRTISKEERIALHLEPKYTSGSVFHFRGGLIAELEDELVKTRPMFDDLKDALATAVKFARRPVRGTGIAMSLADSAPNTSRFGGRRL